MLHGLKFLNEFTTYEQVCCNFLSSKLMAGCMQDDRTLFPLQSEAEEKGVSTLIHPTTRLQRRKFFKRRLPVMKAKRF